MWTNRIAAWLSGGPDGIITYWELAVIIFTAIGSVLLMLVSFVIRYVVNRALTHAEAQRKFNITIRDALLRQGAIDHSVEIP